MHPIRQRIVVLCGAGISAESGIPTFRDSNGLWKQNDYKKLASVGGYYDFLTELSWRLKF